MISNLFIFASIGMMATAEYHDKIDTSEMAIIAACEDLQGTWDAEFVIHPVEGRIFGDEVAPLKFEGLEKTAVLPSDVIGNGPSRAIGIVEYGDIEAVLFLIPVYKLDPFAKSIEPPPGKPGSAWFVDHYGMNVAYLFQGKLKTASRVNISGIPMSLEPGKGIFVGQFVRRAQR